VTTRASTVITVTTPLWYAPHATGVTCLVLLSAILGPGLASMARPFRFVLPGLPETAPVEAVAPRELGCRAERVVIGLRGLSRSGRQRKRGERSAGRREREEVVDVVGDQAVSEVR
jgi:hypothetical protein